MQHYSFFFQYGTLGFFGPAKQASTESIAKYIFDDDPQSKHDLKYIKQKLNKEITISKAKQPFSSFASNRAVFDFVLFSPHFFYYFRCCQTYFVQNTIIWEILIHTTFQVQVHGSSEIFGILLTPFFTYRAHCPRGV